MCWTSNLITESFSQQQTNQKVNETIAQLWAAGVVGGGDSNVRDISTIVCKKAKWKTPAFAGDRASPAWRLLKTGKQQLHRTYIYNENMCLLN